MAFTMGKWSGEQPPIDLPYKYVEDQRVGVGTLVAAGYRPYVYVPDNMKVGLEPVIIWSTSPDAVSRFTMRKAVPLRMPNGMVIKAPAVILIDEQDGGFINKIA